LSYLFRRISYEWSISALAAIVLMPLIPALLADYPESSAGFQLADLGSMLLEPAVWIAAVALFCYASLDASFSNWLPAFGKEVILQETPAAEPAAADASAQRLISVYAVALIVGRLLASQIPAITLYGSWFIAAASLLTALLIVVMTNTSKTWSAWVLVFAAGLLSAPFFPTIIGIMAAKYDPGIFGSIFGIVFAGALLGGTTVPKLIGNLAEGSTIQRSLKLLMPLCLILIVLVLALGTLAVRNQEFRHPSVVSTTVHTVGQAVPESSQSSTGTSTSSSIGSSNSSSTSA
jgi:fucose permease